MATILVRFYGGAAEAAGASEQTWVAPNLGALIEKLSTGQPRLLEVLKVASFLLDGVSWRDLEAPLPEHCTIDVLPPFAGG